MRTPFTLKRSMIFSFFGLIFLLICCSPAFSQTYCIPVADCSVGDQIQNFSTTGALVNITNNNSGCSPSAYANLTATHSITVTPGSTFNISVQAGSAYSQGHRIWIDWNQDGDFYDAGEDMWNSGTYSTNVYTGTITVPLTAMSGTTRMRVRCSYNTVPTDPCTQQSYGEAEDYGVFVAGTVDASVQNFISIPDTLCSGLQPVEVIVKNFGPHAMTSVKIGWKINNVAQTIHNWSGNLPANDTAHIVIGSFNFLYGTTYNLTAYTSNPNNTADTINNNDTLHKTGLFTKPSPTLTLSDTIINICQGDTAYLTGALTGSPPWNIIITDGTDTVSFNNIIIPSASLAVKPSATKTYTIISITDLTGCDNKSSPKVLVSVQPAPPANITPQGSGAKCQGDSVVLFGSIGLSFSYQWYLNGTILPADTNYICYAKTGGQYTVKVTSPIGCSAVSAPFTAVIHPAPPVFLGNDTALLPHKSITLDAGPSFNSYLWSNNSTFQTLYVDSSGTGIGVKTVWVRVTDNFACVGIDTILINFTNNPGISGTETDPGMQIFPNPTTGIVELQMIQLIRGVYNIELFSQDGKPVYRSEYFHNSGNENIKLILDFLPPGLYLLKVINNENALIKKLIISR